MEAFASVEQYREMYPNDTVQEQRLEALLMSASVQLRQEFKRKGLEIGDDEDLLFDLCCVCMAMAHRAVQCDDVGPYSQTSETAGPYSQTRTYANPNGDMYLTSNERRRLGLSKSVFRTIRPMIEGADDSW